MSNMTGGNARIQFVFNAHLPFVRFPQYEDFLEERWFFEAMLESYLPMVDMLDGLKKDNIPYHCSWVVSPTLVSMADDELLKKRFLKYVQRQLSLVEKEKKRCGDQEEYYPIVCFYEERFQKSLQTFNRFDGSLLQAWSSLAQGGEGLELIPTAATGVFLPLYRSCPQVVRTQISCGLANFRDKLAGYNPKGFWLPFCGYFPDLEYYLQEEGLQYTFLSTSALSGEQGMADPNSYKIFQNKEGFEFFPVSRLLLERVLDQQMGYSTHPVYRDFYRDIAFELPLEDIGDYALHHGERVPTGLKYLASTGKTQQKDIYRPQRAHEQAREHAQDFVENLVNVAKELSVTNNVTPVMTCALDVEFFGHWWFEGVTFWDQAFRSLHNFKNMTACVPSSSLGIIKTRTEIAPSFASWGEDNYAQVWLSDKNDWLVRHFYVLVERMTELAQRFDERAGLRKRILDQAAREVLLALSSDWPMLLHNGSNEKFALDQIRRHFANFYKICDGLSSNEVYVDWFIGLEKQDNIFLGKNFTYKAFTLEKLPSPDSGERRN